MLTLHLARHGDTTQSSEGVFCGDLDPPLTDKGKIQAEKLARVTATLDLEAVYVSPKLRALQTAEATLAATKLKANVRDGLREIGYGTWEGRHEKEIKASEREAYDAWVADPALVSPPGGENAFAIAARALPVLLEVRHAHPNGRVLFVSHKATVRVLVCALLGLPLGRFRDRVACPTASLTTIEFGDRGQMLTRIGDTTHLK
jgi:probable phosphoglycerate mutase